MEDSIKDVKNKRLSSFGNKVGELSWIKEGKGSIKEERIIEEKMEESPSIHSHSKSETKGNTESELEKDLASLLDSGQLPLRKKSTMQEE